MATTNDPIKKARLEKRSNQKMQKAKATWKDAETLKQEAFKSRNPADAGDAEQLYKKAARQGERAKKLKAKKRNKDFFVTAYLRRLNFSQV